MKYKNEKTGEIIEIKGKLSGGDWKELKAPSRSREKKAGEENGSIRNDKRCKRTVEKTEKR